MKKRLLSAVAAAWFAMVAPAAAATIVIDFEGFAPGTEAPSALGPLAAGGAFRIADGPAGGAAYGYVAPGSPDAGLFLIGDFLFQSVDLLATGSQDIVFTFYNFDSEAGALGKSVVFRPGELSLQTFLFPVLDFVPNFTMVTSDQDFYLDNLTGRLPVASAVPEPSSWIMMILGFGLAGGALRQRLRPKAIGSAGRTMISPRMAGLRP